MNTIPITQEGMNALRDEIEDLKKNQRPAIIEAIVEARAHGDLKENAEYHAAREQQGFIEGRIKELEGTAASVQVIDIASLNPGDKVVFGAKIELFRLSDEQVIHYQIVGEYEANLEFNKISITSPLARSLVGKSIGEVVTVHTPDGEVEYEIISAEY